MANPTVNSELCVNVAGPVGIWVNTGPAYALEHLGWSQDGIQIQEIPYITGIPGDQNGGSDGPPIEYQQFVSQHRIVLDLNKYSETVMAKVALRANPAAAITQRVGQLLFCSAQYYRVLLTSFDSEGTVTFIRNYPYCVPFDPIDANYGSKYTRKQVVFTANTIGGVLWNTTGA